MVEAKALPTNDARGHAEIWSHYSPSSTAITPQTVGQVEVSNAWFERILERTIRIARIVKALGFVYSITRASNPQLHFGNPDILI
ncbi:hypothetical protein Tco_0811244 [Tanacetum coccineum]